MSYRLQRTGAEVDADALAAMSPEDHRQAFAAFVAGLLADFDRYLDRARIDLVADMVSYRQAALWLTDDELAELLTEIRAAIGSRLDQGSAPGRTRRLLSTILVPVADPPG